MKRLILGIALAVTAIGLSVFEMIYINTGIKKTEENIERTAVYQSEGETRLCEEAADRALECWENFNKGLNVFVNHQEPDKISDNIIELRQTVCSDGDDSKIVYAKIKRQLDSLWRNELPVLENIL
ncbi:MAG: DUF4363 family protein [Ruminococcus sp.]